ncbi:MAG: helix-turn-helix transcriptional regulator [Bradyrhizobium sp.]|uniref:helix-turn-helix transcriptional regulator n=1 Tax=Bradyrhizobium sp. TaxID=376 RepID=UPI001D4A1139|nr:AraC family transcriptional regulator [Bradyrhizobium sp.]MBV9561688.1 helix-turn-helix transcriptional regulator [Bradyrhizobium sp.]
MDVIRKTLFESGSLQIGLVEVRPRSDACGDVEQQSTNVMVLPVSGLFTKHEAPGRAMTGTSSHAVLVAADTPYRVSFPGAIGDRALTLRFGADLVPGLMDGADTASHGLLPPDAMMLRSLLLTRLATRKADAFEAETLGLDLLAASLRATGPGASRSRRATDVRQSRALERVKEAVALAPSDNWNVARLARIANLSSFHLCHVFRQITGTSLYRYVLRERLSSALAAVLDGGDDLTSIALEAGFASHSHFTAHFRKFFGCTPAVLRRTATVAGIAEFRKIVTASGRHPA